MIPPDDECPVLVLHDRIDPVRGRVDDEVVSVARRIAADDGAGLLGRVAFDCKGMAEVVREVVAGGQVERRVERRLELREARRRADDLELRSVEHRHVDRLDQRVLEDRPLRRARRPERYRADGSDREDDDRGDQHCSPVRTALPGTLRDAGNVGRLGRELHDPRQCVFEVDHAGSSSGLSSERERAAGVVQAAATVPLAMPKVVATSGSVRSAT